MQNTVKYLHYICCNLTFFFEGGKFDICQLIRLIVSEIYLILSLKILFFFSSIFIFKVYKKVKTLYQI